MDGYLKGYYGYRNFGDELLFFGIIQRILDNYSLDTLYVEVGEKHRMEKWIEMNGSLKIEHGESKALMDNVRFVEGKQHKHKIITHIINFLGGGKYRKLFKFFGGGEVLTDERPFPHDGWNIPLLFGRTVRKGQFILLGGIATPHKRYTRLLYKILFAKAQKIVVRDNISYATIKRLENKKEKKEKFLLHQDFAVGTIHAHMSQLGGKRPLGGAKYILININHKECTSENREKIQAFCKQYPLHQKIFFPCDMHDDAKEYTTLKHDVHDLIYYNRTEHNVHEILDMFAYCDGGVGCRLHFLLPLKLYKKSFEAIPYAEKIEKLIIT